METPSKYLVIWYLLQFHREISTKETLLALQRALSSHKAGGERPESRLNFAARGFVRNCRLVSVARQRVSSFLKGECSRENEEQKLPPQECSLLNMCEIVVFLNKLHRTAGVTPTSEYHEDLVPWPGLVSAVISNDLSSSAYVFINAHSIVVRHSADL